MKTHSCLKMQFFFHFRKSKVTTQLKLDYHITYAYRVFSHQTVLIYSFSISSLQSTGRQHTQKQCKKWYFDILFMNSFSCIHSSVWSKHLSPNTCRWIMLFFCLQNILQSGIFPWHPRRGPIDLNTICLLKPRGLLCQWTVEAFK